VLQCIPKYKKIFLYLVLIMSKKHYSPVIICFGELLWDNLPSGKMAGGAPMNVAYHLNRIGAGSQLISAVGNDQAGADLIAFSKQIDLPVNLLQTDTEHATSEVIAKIIADHEVVYDILPDVAWDFIRYDDQFEQLAKDADAFVFGSLAARNTLSRETLLQILEFARYKVLDINLRPPHYSKEILDLLLSKADLLKLNSDELRLLTAWFYKENTTEADSISFLQETFEINEVILTKGSSGASYYAGNESYTGKAYPVRVEDTIGAGDSFLAAFLYQKLSDADIPLALDYALGMGAFIAGQKGACPPYTRTELEHFIAQHQR
jgi:fructokinase